MGPIQPFSSSSKVLSTRILAILGWVLLLGVFLYHFHLIVKYAVDVLFGTIDLTCRGNKNHLRKISISKILGADE